MPPAALCSSSAAAERKRVSLFPLSTLPLYGYAERVSHKRRLSGLQRIQQGAGRTIVSLLLLYGPAALCKNDEAHVLQPLKYKYIFSSKQNDLQWR